MACGGLKGGIPHWHPSAKGGGGRRCPKCTCFFGSIVTTKPHGEADPLGLDMDLRPPRSVGRRPPGRGGRGFGSGDPGGGGGGGGAPGSALGGGVTLPLPIGQATPMSKHWVPLIFAPLILADRFSIRSAVCHVCLLVPRVWEVGQEGICGVLCLLVFRIVHHVLDKVWLAVVLHMVHWCRKSRCCCWSLSQVQIIGN